MDVDGQVNLIELCKVEAWKLSGNCCLLKFYVKRHGVSKGFPNAWNAWNQKYFVVEDRSNANPIDQFQGREVGYQRVVIKEYLRAKGLCLKLMS